MEFFNKLNEELSEIVFNNDIVSYLSSLEEVLSNNTFVNECDYFAVINESTILRDKLKELEEYLNRFENCKLIMLKFPVLNELYDTYLFMFSNDNQNVYDVYSVDATEQYLKLIRKYRLLTAEEEYELSKIIAMGDKEAREKLINHNLRLVVKIAFRFRNHGRDISDLIQDGNLGLIKAAKLYDYTSGCRFSTYAYRQIFAKIRREIDNNKNAIRKPIWASDLWKKAEDVKRDYYSEYQKNLSLEEVAKILNVRESTLQHAYLDNRRVHITAKGNDGDLIDSDPLLNFADQGSPLEDKVELKILLEEIKNYLIMSNFSERDIDIYFSCLYDAKRKDLSEKYGITSERVSQIDKRVSKNVCMYLKKEPKKRYSIWRFF